MWAMTPLTDTELIANLGGPSKVAALIGLDKRAGGAQRVQNWLKRGIPAEVKLQYPAYFLPHLVASPQAQATQAAQP